EERFQAYMQNSPLVCFIKDEWGRLVYINRLMEEKFGVAAADIIGKTDYDWLPFDVAQATIEVDKEVFRTGETKQCVEWVPTPGGATHELLVMKFRMGSQDGRQLLGGIATDVGEQKRSERALQESEK